MKKKFIIILILAIISGGIGIGIARYFYPPMAETVDTSGWSSYTFANFSFYYPPDWKVEKRGSVITPTSNGNSIEIIGFIDGIRITTANESDSDASPSINFIQSSDELSDAPTFFENLKNRFQSRPRDIAVDDFVMRRTQSKQFNGTIVNYSFYSNFDISFRPYEHSSEASRVFETIVRTIRYRR